VENPRKRFDLKGHSKFNTTKVSVTRIGMLHLCDMPTTKAKLLLEKATKSRATHSIRASHHRPVQKDTESSGK
jgi:hypothetical protein